MLNASDSLNSVFLFLKLGFTLPLVWRFDNLCSAQITEKCNLHCTVEVFRGLCKPYYCSSSWEMNRVRVFDNRLIIEDLLKYGGVHTAKFYRSSIIMSVALDQDVPKISCFRFKGTWQVKYCFLNHLDLWCK